MSNNFSFSKVPGLRIHQRRCSNTFFICPQLTFICSKSTKEILEKGLSDRNGIRTHNNLVRKKTLNHLAKLAYRVWIVCGFTLKRVRDMIKYNLEKGGKYVQS